MIKPKSLITSKHSTCDTRCLWQPGTCLKLSPAHYVLSRHFSNDSRCILEASFLGSRQPRTDFYFPLFRLPHASNLCALSLLPYVPRCPSPPAPFPASSSLSFGSRLWHDLRLQVLPDFLSQGYRLSPCAHFQNRSAIPLPYAWPFPTDTPNIRLLSSLKAGKQLLPWDLIQVLDTDGAQKCLRREGGKSCGSKSYWFPQTSYTALSAKRLPTKECSCPLQELSDEGVRYCLSPFYKWGT